MFVPGEKLLVFRRAERRGLLGRENLFQKAELGLHHGFVIESVEVVEPLAFAFKRLEVFFVFGIGDGGEVEIDRMQRKRGDCGVGIGILPRVRGAGVVDGQKLDEFESDFIAPVGERLEVEEFAGAKTLFAAQAEDRDGHARCVPVIRRQIRKAVVDERMLVARPGIIQGAVRARLKPHVGILRNIEHAVFVGDRKTLAAQIQWHGEIIFAGFAPEQDGRFGFPVAEPRAVAEQAERLILLEQRGLDAEGVRGVFRRNGFDGGEIFREQNFFERLRVKCIFNPASLVPRIQDEQFGAVKFFWNQNAVAAPVGGLRAVGVAQNVGVAERHVGGFGGERDGGLPEFVVEELQRHGMAGQGMAARQPERLAGLGGETEPEGQIHARYLPVFTAACKPAQKCPVRGNGWRQEQLLNFNFYLGGRASPELVMPARREVGLLFARPKPDSPVDSLWLMP